MQEGREVEGKSVIRIIPMNIYYLCAFLLAKKPFFVRMLNVEKCGLLHCSSFCERLPFNLYYTSAIEHSGYLRVEDSISSRDYVCYVTS